MTPQAHLIGHDYSVYYDLAAVAVVLCLCMLACSLWLAYQKRSLPFIGSVWGGFLFLLLLGAVGLSIFIHEQRLVRRDNFAKLVASYADIVGRLNHWKIQPGNPELFSDWSSPFLLLPDQRPFFSWGQIVHDSSINEPILAKLAVPEGLTAGWEDVPSDYDKPIHVQRRNQWAVAKLTQDSKAFGRSTQKIFVQWKPVPQATVYRLQWRDAHSENTDWITAYSGSKPFCILTAPDEASLALRVRAENGTSEDDPDFGKIVDTLDFPAATNSYVGYAYTMRFADQQHLQFIAAPISDANHNGFIDADEEPNDIGELFPTDPLFQYVHEHKERAMSFEVFVDKWGKWFTIVEPIWTSDKKMDGILAMDFKVDTIHRAMFLERIYPLCLFVLVIGVYFGAVLFVNHLQIKAAAISQLAETLQYTVMELTETKKITEKALHVKTLFLTNMSHEFRTPLSAILGYTEILTQYIQEYATKELEPCMEVLEHMKEHGKSLLELVNNILSVVAMDGSQAPRLTFTSVNLRDLILGVAEMMRSRAESKSLLFTVDEPHDVPEWIWSDPAHIRQVVILLVDNAIKFTHEGSVSIRYGISSVSPSPNTLLLDISVEDTGIGIDPDHLESIFMPFSQSDSSFTRQYSGTGISLSVARQTAERLNGSISVESQPGCGSVFTFTFPGQIAEPVLEKKL